MNQLAIKVERYIKENKLLGRDDIVILGLSGGMDSMALCDILLKAKRSIGFKLYAAHMDHRIREESGDDALFVAAYCDRNDIELYHTQADVLKEAKYQKISVELAARHMRHGFFDTILREHCNAKLALAHHMNDKAETMLMRLFRGTSIDGLAPMPAIDRHIIRPFMCATRDDILEYAQEIKLKWREDYTNSETKYTRNNIRHNIIPQIKENFNPSIISTLCNEAKSFYQDSQYLQECGQNAAKLAKKTNDGYMLEDEDFMYLNPSIRKRAIKHLLRELGKTSDLYEKNLMAVEGLFIKRRTGALVELPGGFKARAYPMGVELIRGEDAKEILDEIPLRLDGITYLSNGDSIECETVNTPKKYELSHSPYVQYIDYMSISNDIILRNRRSGDRIHPLGSSGSKKLKDYFIDKHVSRWERDSVVLLMCDNDVVWAVGHGIGDKYKVTDESVICIKIVYRKAIINE